MRRKFTLFDLCLYIGMILFSIIVLYPFYYCVINSFNISFAKSPALLWPQSFSLKAYETVFNTDQIIRAFFVSVARTALGIISNLTVCLLAAFALRKRNLVFRNFYLVLFTIPMFFNGGLIPNYINYRNLNLINNFLIYILPSLFTFYFVIILMSNFGTIPSSLEESANIDGANSFTVLFRIFVPISVPVIATLSLFSGVNQWNKWFDTLYFTTSSDLETLASVLIRVVTKSNMTQELSQMQSRETELIFSIGETVKLSTMVIAVVPIVFLYPFVQRFFVKGITIGSVKE